MTKQYGKFQSKLDLHGVRTQNALYQIPAHHKKVNKPLEILYLTKNIQRKWFPFGRGEILENTAIVGNIGSLIISI